MLFSSPIIHLRLVIISLAKDFEKADEIYFRLGIIYKQQQKYPESLEVCTSLIQ